MSGNEEPLNCSVNTIIQFNGAYYSILGIVFNLACYSFAMTALYSFRKACFFIYFPFCISNGMDTSMTARIIVYRALSIFAVICIVGNLRGKKSIFRPTAWRSEIHTMQSLWT